MNYGGKYLVFWKDMKVDGTDALMRSFDTTIEAKAYIQGCVDSVVTFTKGANESKLIKEFEIRNINNERK